MSTQTTHDHDHNPNFPSTLQKVYHELQTKHSTATEELLISQDGSQFLAARRSLRDGFDTSQFRTSLGSLLGLTSAFNVVQVVGDSGSAFSPRGIERVKEVIRSLVSSGSGATVLEYGYTASQHDVNWIVNDLISEDEEELAGRTVANLVFESARAVAEWGCEAKRKVDKFVLAYDEDGETRFGDDVFLSDEIMDGGYGDQMVCVEGGVQAFEQVCGVLGRGVGVFVVTGKLREEENTSMSASRFSAARLLKDCADGLMAGRERERVQRDLLSDLVACGGFQGKPDLYKRVEFCLRQILVMHSDKVMDIRVIGIH